LLLSVVGGVSQRGRFDEQKTHDCSAIVGLGKFFWTF
jgi:hypothetical protein